MNIINKNVTLTVEEFVKQVYTKWEPDCSGRHKFVYFCEEKYTIKISKSPVWNNEVIREFVNYKVYRKLGLATMVAKCYQVGFIAKGDDKLAFIIQEKVNNIWGDYDNPPDIDPHLPDIYMLFDDSCHFNFGKRGDKIVCLDYTHINISRVYQQMPSKIKRMRLVLERLNIEYIDF